MFHFRETKDVYKEFILLFIHVDEINMADICRTSAVYDMREECVDSNRFWALNFVQQQKFRSFLFARARGWKGGVL